MDASRSAIAMEAWCLIVSLPEALKRRRFTVIIPLMALPCFMLVRGGFLAAVLEPYLAVALPRIGMVVAMMSLFLVFLGGLPTLMLTLAVGQLLAAIHNIPLAPKK